MNEKNELNGTWENGCFKLVIKKNKYVSFYKGSRYGKGRVVYDNENFTLTSIHAKTWLFWSPFVEIVTGKYSIGDKEVRASNIEGRYCDCNGTWTYIPFGRNK